MGDNFSATPSRTVSNRILFLHCLHLISGSSKYIGLYDVHDGCCMHGWDISRPFCRDVAFYVSCLSLTVHRCNSSWLPYCITFERNVLPVLANLCVCLLSYLTMNCNTYFAMSDLRNIHQALMVSLCLGFAYILDSSLNDEDISISIKMKALNTTDKHSGGISMPSLFLFGIMIHQTHVY